MGGGVSRESKQIVHESKELIPCSFINDSLEKYFFNRNTMMDIRQLKRSDALE